MKPGKIKAMLFIIVFLLVVALVCAWATGEDAPSGGSSSGSSTVTVPIVPTPDRTAAEPAETEAPEEMTAVLDTPTPAPVITPAPTAEPTPEPTPVPTPEPTPTPAPEIVLSGTPIASGSFSSKTKNNIDIRADWEAYAGDNDTANIKVTVYVVCWTLNLNPSTDALKINLGGEYATVGTPAITYTGSSQLVSELGSRTFNVRLTEGMANVPLAVEWHFGGSYGGVAIDAIECGGNITFG